MSEGQVVPGSLYIYAPNKGAPVFFGVAFLGLGLCQTWQCHHYKDWRLTVLHPLCCFIYTAGFALREFGAFNYEYNPVNLALYIVSICLIYAALPILELANFHVLGRILYFVPYCAPMHPGRVLTTFGLLSLLVEVLNGIGASFLTNPKLPERLGRLGDAILKAGLALQIVVIALFFLCTGAFHVRCARAGVLPGGGGGGGGGSSGSQNGGRKRRVATPLLVMYASTALVLVRTIYRSVEYFGFDRLAEAAAADEMSPFLRYEWFFYVFDASVMLVNSCLWTGFHPRKYLPVNNRIYLEHDGVTETEGPGSKVGRSSCMMLADPFGCLGKAAKGWSQRKE